LINISNEEWHNQPVKNATPSQPMDTLDLGNHNNNVPINDEVAWIWDGK
jgi:hypothetical protein